jgi:hypothetical protein
MKIFISSTFRDLKEEREKLHISLKKAGLESLGMEFFVAEPSTPKEVCLREINNANLVLLLISDNYGTKDKETGKSYTQLEFDTAQNAKIETLGFLQKRPTDTDVQKFQDEVKNSGITIDYFENIGEIWTAIFPALFKYVISKGLIPNKTKTFNDFVQFYARSSQKDSIFNYSQAFFGRQEELATLESFLSDGNKQIALISATGGIGKSKLVYEFTQNKLNKTDWNFRFVPWQVGFDNDSIRELPAQKTCVIIEDAHKQKALDAIIYSLINNFPYDMKIIITTRPSGLKSIQETLRDYNSTKPIELQRLSRDDSIALSKSILKNRKQQYAEAIYHHANGNTLVIVIASELVQNDLLEGSLINDDVFIDKVLNKLLAELDIIDNRNINLNKLMATIAGLSPLNYETSTIELLSQLFNIQKHDLEAVLDDLQKHGFTVRIGNRLRVVPDILADYILYKYSVNTSKEPTDFIDTLLKVFGREYLGNLLVNAAELEYQVNESSLSLTDNIWAIINERIEKCNQEELCSILSTIEPVSYFAPDKVHKIVSNILDFKTQIVIDGNTKADTYELSRIMNYIIKILSTLAKRPEFTKLACMDLWDILLKKDYDKLFDNFSESPSSALKKIASLDNDNRFSIQKEAMDVIKEIINTKQHVGHENELSEIIESALKPEIESNTFSKRTFSIGWFCAYDINNPKTLKNLISARNYAFELYSLLIDNSDDRTLFPIVNNLISKLRMPYLKTHKVADQAKAEFEREALKANKLLKKIITKNIPPLNNYIYELAAGKEERLLDNIKIEDVISENMKSDYDIFYCIRHDWPQDYDDDFDSRDKRFSEMQEKTARQLWKRCNDDPEKLIDFIQDYRNSLLHNGIPYDNFAFLIACAKVEPALCPKAIEIIVGRNKDDYIASMISIWLQCSQASLQYELSQRILKNGNSCHRTSLARSLAQLRGMTENELVELIECLSKDTEHEVVDATIRGLGLVCHHRKIAKELPRVINVICNYETQNDQYKLEALLDNFNPHWISPEVLNDDQVSLILKKIKCVKKLESQHDTGVFLSRVITKKPLECVKLFLWRIQNITSDDAQAFPYNEGFHDKPNNLIAHPEYHKCIIEILNTMKKYDWRVYFWCPTVIRWLDPAFTDTTKKVLIENMKLHNNVLKAVTCIFVGYERDFFFNNIDFINQILIEASNLADKKTENSIQGKLTFMPFSGTRYMSGLCEHDNLCLEIIKKCEAILEGNPSYPETLKKFYKGLIKAAKHEDRQKLDGDKAELEEEEF